MKTIAHLSDLHFGAEDEKIAQALKKEILRSGPDLLVITGDLTQRGRKGQFAAAKEYLDGFSFPRLIVPGNHDLPLVNLFRRSLSPLARYRRYISNELDPFYRDDEIAVCGVTSPRRLSWKSGRVSLEQMEEVRDKLCPLPPSVFKMIAIHHPFIPPPEDESVRVVGRSWGALKVMEECGVELVLTGHLHHGYSGDIRPYYPQARRSIIVVQAGTSISRRTREDPNGYNRVHV
ncbi:MAG TPA: metallophosphoesterase family protein, partial [Syntrophales bacterium]